MQEEKLLAAFKAFDTDGSGKISSQELMKILGGFFLYMRENREIY